jgi:rubredoxin
MGAMLAWDELAEKRIHKEVTGGSRWNTYFFQPEKGTRLPQAFLVENTPHRVLRTHYHDVDQFQVIVQGGGTLGKHAVRPYTVHFARAHTPYGPIAAGESGIAWLTIRARRDAEGAQFLPEKRAQLEQAVGRKPWQISRDALFPDSDEDVCLRAVQDMADDRGLAAYSLRMKPNATTQAPDPAGTGGQYLVVLRGSLHDKGREQRALAIGYVAPGEGRFRFTAGGEGLDALILHFPRHDAPIQAAQAVAERTLKTWRCLLCSFVYDEAEGLPDEGIAPGTRWEDVPETFNCADCGATKGDFEMVEA